MSYHFKSSKIKNKCSNCKGLKGLPLKRIIIKRDKTQSCNRELQQNKFELLFILYILSLQNRWQNKVDNEKESSILIEHSYIASKNELEMNLILRNEPSISPWKLNSKWIWFWQMNLVYGGKIDGKVNLEIRKWTLSWIIKKGLDSRPSPLDWIIIYYLLFLVNLLL